MSIVKLYKYQELRCEYFSLKDSITNDKQKDRLMEWKKNIEDLQEKRDKLKAGILEKQKLLKKLISLNEDIAEKESDLEEQLYGGKITNPKELLSRQKKLLELQEKKQQNDKEHENELDKLEELELQLVSLNEKLTDEIKPFQLGAAQYKQEREISKANLNALVAEIKDMERKINPKLLKTYMKNVKKPGDRVLVPLEGEKCSGCNVDISKACVADVKTGKMLVNCENCGRMLFTNNE